MGKQAGEARTDGPTPATRGPARAELALLPTAPPSSPRVAACRERRELATARCGSPSLRCLPRVVHARSRLGSGSGAVHGCDGLLSKS
eukprot:52082-Chlamydomonas_euryale.AAC.2